jgi:exodeoxyribonuclease-3
MKIATWNVNSIRVRQERLLAWIEKAQPDVVCLQELKVADDVFPYETMRQAGHHTAVFSQPVLKTSFPTAYQCLVF